MSTKIFPATVRMKNTMKLIRFDNTQCCFSTTKTSHLAVNRYCLKCP